MNRLQMFLLATLFVGLLSSCKKDDGTTNPPPASDWPPAGSVVEVEPNDTAPQSLGNLATADIVVAGTTSNASDVDRYSVVVQAGTNLSVRDSMVSSTVEADLRVADGSGIVLAYQAGTGPRSCTLTSRPAGTYILEVRSNSTSSARYLLRVGSR